MMRFVYSQRQRRITMRGSLEELPNMETDLHGSLARFFTSLVKL